MQRPFSNEEISRAVFDCHPEKAPGPDGFSVSFFHKNWSIIGKDVIDSIQHFFSTGKLLASVNHTSLSLIPKISKPITFSDFRPISCCNSMYKFISKCLSNRLRKVIGYLISPSQSTFIKGRCISDNILLAHELVRNFNRKYGKRCCLKLDLRKAFDSANREFIYYIMHLMKFPHTWINWIRECIQGPTFSVSVNGIPSASFTSSKGIRQGDPLSPYLFVMVMECLSIKLDTAMIQRHLHPIKRNIQPIISHLLFADDILVFCRADKKSFQKLKSILNEFQNFTGLAINSEKSTCFLSRACGCDSDLLSILGIPQS